VRVPATATPARKPAATVTSGEPRDFTGVELLAAGNWHASTGDTEVTVDMLHAMAAADAATRDVFHAPVKLGHDDTFGDSMPAAGWVTNLRVVGSKLLGDLKAVPAKLARLIENGAYRHRSAEVRGDFDINGKTYPWAFTGLALLGASLPAVDGLADIVSTYLARGLGPATPGALCFAGGNATHPRVVLRFAAAPATSETAPMDPQALITELMQLCGASTPEELKAKVGAMVNAGAAPVAAAAAAPAAIAAARADIDAARTELARTKAENTALTSRVLTLEGINASRAAADLVSDAEKAGKLTPAQRPTALAFALKDPTGFAAHVAASPKVIEFGERGVNTPGGEGPDALARITPNATDIAFARAVGNDLAVPANRKAFMRTRARELSIPVTDAQLDAAVAK
jgi:Mu-like prophage I protein